jgi:hypothetical protein
MQSQVDRARALTIREAVREAREVNPKLTFQQAWEQVRAKEPNLFAEGATSQVLIPAASDSDAFVGTPVDDPEQVRQRKIQGLVEEFLSDHPGITFKTAYLSVQHENPKLFPEMESLDVKEKNMAAQEKIKAAVEELRARKPHLNFAAAWHALQREKPELFDFESA